MQRIRVWEFTDQRPDAVVDVVGESFRQEVIHEVLAGWPNSSSIPAILVPEPDNPKDRNAVRVMLRTRPEGDFAQVGYLSREDAQRYLPVVAAASPGFVMAAAWVKHGGDRGPAGTPMHGVALRLGSPGELLLEMWIDGRQLPTQHRWSGQMVCFTGPSSHAIMGVRMDREAQLALASKIGCQPWPRMTKKVQVCVVGNSTVDTEKVQKAEDYGAEVVTEFDFWRDAGLSLDRF